MKKKIKFLFKFSFFLSCLFAFTVIFVLGEVQFLGDSIEETCAENGVQFPIKNPNILVDISDRTMSLRDGERLIRRFDIGVGKSRRVGVLDRSVRSTPVGEYRIVKKHFREDMFSRGSRFLQIDYPSLDDLDSAFDSSLITRTEYDRCVSAVKRGDAIPDGTKLNPTLGIQGNYFLIRGANFTDGSVAMKNSDLNDLYEHVSAGTLVTIRP